MRHLFDKLSLLLLLLTAGSLLWAPAALAGDSDGGGKCDTYYFLLQGAVGSTTHNGSSPLIQATGGQGATVGLDAAILWPSANCRRLVGLAGSQLTDKHSGNGSVSFANTLIGVDFQWSLGSRIGRGFFLGFLPGIDIESTAVQNVPLGGTNLTNSYTSDGIGLVFSAGYGIGIGENTSLLLGLSASLRYAANLCFTPASGLGTSTACDPDGGDSTSSVVFTVGILW